MVIFLCFARWRVDASCFVTVAGTYIARGSFDLASMLAKDEGKQLFEQVTKFWEESPCEQRSLHPFCPASLEEGFLKLGSLSQVFTEKLSDHYYPDVSSDEGVLKVLRLVEASPEFRSGLKHLVDCCSIQSSLYFALELAHVTAPSLFTNSDSKQVSSGECGGRNLKQICYVSGAYVFSFSFLFWFW